MKTLADLFKQSASLYGNKVCIGTYSPEDAGNTRQALTYEQFYVALCRQAAQLQQQHKLRKGDTIALLADNSLAYVVLAYGATLAGIRVLLVSTRVLPEHLQGFVQSTGCKLMFASSAHESLARGTGVATVYLDESTALSPVRTADAIAVTLDPDDCALIMHTSGTTSVPRLVYLSHRNILSNQQAVHSSVAGHWTTDDSSLVFLPLFHGYTLLSQLLRNLSIGASTVLLQQPGSITAESLVHALKKTRVSFFCCVPWMLKLLHDLVVHEQQANGRSQALEVLRNLNFIITGGAPLERNTGEFLAANGVRLVTFFGLTEAAGFVLHSSFANGKWELLNPVADKAIHFEAVAAGLNEYELVLGASPMVAARSDAGERPAAGAGYRTSDVFRHMDEGWAYLGRNDQMYNGPHGEKINPLLFETELEKHPAVHKVYVNGEDLLFNYALVELRPDYAGSNTVGADILAAIQTRINPALEMPARVYPNDVILLAAGEHLPLTSKGTVDRQAAKAILAARIGAEAPTPAPAMVDIGALVHRQILAYLELPADSAVPRSQGLLELGFDSLMVLSLRNSLQRALNLVIPLDLMLGFPTVDTLVATLEAARRAMPERTTYQAPAATDAQTPGAQWKRIPFEQAIFHTAHYTFPFPTYNVSMSLLAPRSLGLPEVEAGMRYLESRHDVLRSVYTPEGLFTIETRSFVKEALLGTSAVRGSHDIGANAEAQAIIRDYLNCAFDLSKGPVYRYALIDVSDEAGHTRTLVYVGLNHICGDFKGFNALVEELMEFLDHASAMPAPKPDGYAALVAEPAAEDLLQYCNNWRQLMTVMPTLKEGLDFRAGHRRYFHFADVNLDQIAAILRRHNISLYNGVYAIYAVALSRNLANLALEDFHSATAVTARITPETENLMGCFIHSPLLRFRLDGGQSMLQMMTAVQQTTRAAFTEMITSPATYLANVAQDPSNLVPFITRNVFLYRSPDEIMTPLPGWNCYRNEFFFESCDVGMYLDFCANARNQAMEGYVLINLHYCEPGVIQPILDDIRSLLLRVAASPELDFQALACLSQPRPN